MRKHPTSLPSPLTSQKWHVLMGNVLVGLLTAATKTPLSEAFQVRQPIFSSSSSSRRQQSQRQPASALTRRFICSVHGERRGVEIPLLDICDNEEYEKRYVQPLPSTHLPDEMTTLHVYGMQVDLPLHQSVLQYAMDHARDWIGDGVERSFGHVAWKPPDNTDSLVGAIGCAAEVLLPPGMVEAPAGMVDENRNAELFDDDTGGRPRAVLCRGTYRFIVRDIKRSFPFPVAIVDELVDEEVVRETEETSAGSMTDDDEEDDEDDVYADLTINELAQRTMQAMQTHVEQQLEVTVQEMSPLEQSIIEQSGMPGMEAQRQAAEEMAAVWQVFQDYLVDLCPAPTERCFAIGFMAAEMANLGNDVRRQILKTTSGKERLQIVLKQLDDAVGMVRARRMANTITEQVTGESASDPKDLRVGQPSLPPWASAIRKGMRIQYYWNEEWDWCGGTVVEEPVWVVNEYILSIEFDDGEVHKLPFQADEKARWRPERPSL